MIFFAITLATMFSLAIGDLSSTMETNIENSTITASRSPSMICVNYGVEGGSLPNVIFPKCTAALYPKSLRNMVIHGMACACDLGTMALPKRDDYVYTPGLGGHKLHTRGATFNEARKICNEEGGHLAVINSFHEEQKLLELFEVARPIRGAVSTNVALIGTHDLYNEGDWVTILGDSLRTLGYSNWSDQWGGQPDNGGQVQHCGALLKDGGMDDVNCNIPYAFFCETTAIKPAF